MPKLKILHYTDTPILGGMTAQILLLLQNMNKKQVVLHLACPAYKQLDGWVREVGKTGTVVHRFAVKNHNDPAHLHTLRKIIEEVQPDLLHIHLRHPGACRWAFFAAKRIPIVTTEHHVFALRGLKKLVKKLTLRRTVHTICISDSAQNSFCRYYNIPREKTTRIYNGIDLRRWKKSSLPTRQPVITTVAELSPHKGIRYLIEAMLRVEKGTLQIVGDGSDREKLESLVKNLSLQRRIKFLGTRRDIPKILQKTTIFCLPSLSESFGLVALEAMASGLPVVASGVGGLTELVEEGQTGYLVSPANSRAIAERVNILLARSALIKNMGQRGYKKAQQFGAKKCAEETLKVYKKFGFRNPAQIA